MGALDYAKGVYGIGDDHQGHKRGKKGHNWSTSEHINRNLG